MELRIFAVILDYVEDRTYSADGKCIIQSSTGELVYER